jgi:uncharacterized protein YciI
MSHFVLKFLPPRSSFLQDMTQGERQIMQEHAFYWRTQTARGKAIVFGPVIDPRGAWGLAVLDVPDEAAARALIADDPITKASLGKCELFPFHAGAVRG